MRPLLRDPDSKCVEHLWPLARRFNFGSETAPLLIENPNWPDATSSPDSDTTEVRKFKSCSSADDFLGNEISQSPDMGHK